MIIILTLDNAEVSECNTISLLVCSKW